jgi:hypothetical protein
MRRLLWAKVAKKIDFVSFSPLFASVLNVFMYLRAINQQYMRMKQCCIFQYYDANEAWHHFVYEIIENYGDVFCNPDGSVKHCLHTWDDGGRRLVRCKKCGALFLLQTSEFHNMTDGNDSYYLDFFQVGSREEALVYNEKYNGFTLENSYGGTFLSGTNMNWSWRKGTNTREENCFVPEMLKKIDRSIQQAKEGKTVKLTPELRNELFGDL